MKHIEKYNKFNEDLKIIAINEYDLNIIRNCLIEFEDLEWKIYEIHKNTKYVNIYLNDDRSSLNTDFKSFKGLYSFGKVKFIKNEEGLYDYKMDCYINHDITKYEQNIINLLKDSSKLLLNMLEYNYGDAKIISGESGYFIEISLKIPKIKKN